MFHLRTGRKYFQLISGFLQLRVKTFRKNEPYKIKYFAVKNVSSFVRFIFCIDFTPDIIIVFHKKFHIKAFKCFQKQKNIKL